MAKQSLLFYCLSFITLLLLLSKQTLGQHTTSAKFSPNPQPTSSGVYCIQMVCPSASEVGKPSCPEDCQSGCKYIPDQCCPQITLAVCQDGNSSSLPSSSSGLGASITTITTITTTVRVASTSGPTTTHPSSTSPSASVKPNAGIKVQPSVYISLVIVIAIGSLFI